MAYYAHTLKAAKFACNELLRLNGITSEEMLENLSIFLDDEGHVSTTTADLPTNEAVMQSLFAVENVTAGMILKPGSHIGVN